MELRSCQQPAGRRSNRLRATRLDRSPSNTSHGNVNGRSCAPTCRCARVRFRRDDLDRDIRSLYRDGPVRAGPDQLRAGRNTLNLVVEVTPNSRARGAFRGNQKVKGSRLEKEVKIQPNQALDERQVKEDSEKLREYYQSPATTRCRSATRSIAIESAVRHGRLQDSRRREVKIADIKFAGTRTSPPQAGGEMETKKWWMFSWLTARAGSRRSIRGRPRQAARLLP